MEKGKKKVAVNPITDLTYGKDDGVSCSRCCLHRAFVVSSIAAGLTAPLDHGLSGRSSPRLHGNAPIRIDVVG
ncbi:unnamed protein product, partial [Urochloa humidicola]